MAIGLAAMFGFRFPENFNYPYVARSVQEFWRRWHLSLSRWFRDYLYVPLGGNRAGAAAHLRQPGHRVLPVRAVARRQLELRRLGPVPRRVPGDRAPGRRAPSSTRAPRAARARLHARRRDGRLGVLPGRHADRTRWRTCRRWSARRAPSRAVHAGLLRQRARRGGDRRGRGRRRAPGCPPLGRRVLGVAARDARPCALARQRPIVATLAAVFGLATRCSSPRAATARSSTSASDRMREAARPPADAAAPCQPGLVRAVPRGDLRAAVADARALSPGTPDDPKRRARAVAGGAGERSRTSAAGRRGSAAGSPTTTSSAAS